MREGFLRIAGEYAVARSRPFKEHELASFIRDELPLRAKGLIGQLGDSYRVKGSAGQSKWVDSPWMAFMDPLVTDSARRGYYPVYLFNETFDRIALVLGQGTDAIREEFGSAKAKVLLRSRAEVLREKVPEYKQWFKAGPFGVASREKAGEEWDISSTFGRVYDISDMPTNEVLGQDLVRMLELYRLLVVRGGYTVAEDEDTEADDAVEKTEWKEGERRLRVHERLERRRNSSLAREVKRRQGYLCRGCGFDYRAVYGTAGEKYIDAHHLVPLSELTDDGPIARDPIRDFAVLCANCHRMIHKLGCPSLEDFKRAIRADFVESLKRFVALVDEAPSR